MELTTPERKRREVRELYLPEITKNTYVKKKEIDLTTLFEDPLFDPSRRPKRTGLRGGKMSLDGRALTFGQPLLPSGPSTTQATSQINL